MPFGVFSEVGRLRLVMVHRPGLEHAWLTPSNASVPYPRADHDPHADRGSYRVAVAALAIGVGLICHPVTGEAPIPLSG